MQTLLILRYRLSLAYSKELILRHRRALVPPKGLALKCRLSLPKSWWFRNIVLTSLHVNSDIYIYIYIYIYIRRGNSHRNCYFQRKSDYLRGRKTTRRKHIFERILFFLENIHFRADLNFRSARREPAFSLPCSKLSVARVCCTRCVTVHIVNLFRYHSRHIRCGMHCVCHFWYDLRGWLGVKQQLSVYLSVISVCLPFSCERCTRDETCLRWLKWSIVGTFLKKLEYKTSGSGNGFPRLWKLERPMSALELTFAKSMCVEQQDCLFQRCCIRQSWHWE